MKFTTMIFTSALLALSTLLYAQNKHFTTNGTIEYDKTVNMFAILKKQITKDNETYMQPAYDKYIKEKPQFIKLKSMLTFSNGQTLFTPMEDPENSGGFIDNPLVSQNNIIFSDIRPGICTAQKKSF